MSTTGMATIQCPTCQRSLPPNAQTCHFCGTALTNVSRPKPAGKAASNAPSWTEGLYYSIAGYMMLIGVGHVVLDAQRLASLPKPVPSSVSGYFYFLFALGVFQTTLGLGLILRWDWARSVVRVFCWIAIFLAALSLLMNFGALAIGNIYAITRMLLAVLDIVAWGALLWLLSETDY